MEIVSIGFRCQRTRDDRRISKNQSHYLEIIKFDMITGLRFQKSTCVPLHSAGLPSSSPVSTTKSVHGAPRRGFELRCRSQKYEFEEDELALLETMELDDLRSSMDDAIEQELYEKAAVLRDRIIEKEQEKNPVLLLKQQLELAVEEERYLDAAELRDKISVLAPVPENDQASAAQCCSNTVTEGVEVSVQSIYVPQHSGSTAEYMFAYKITITNVSHPTTIKLVARRWEITDGKGRMRIVEGSGVIGEQPELRPGASFTYQSVCPLETTSGKMKGHFEMYSRASPNTSWNTSFLVDIAEFSLDVDGPQYFN